uniref:Indoleacetamide hydrolase (IAH) ) n=1 Tax=Ganoderma boninense TaxID=34458 RepID=A0A5K1JZB6_9APHY|nr:Indoleacetamide hydrolase (IAH) (EC (Indole-3-acetamide hydrolase) [Ganoderma boninense]
MDPRLWENGQRLNEWDPKYGNLGKFTEAAEKAQDAKWKRLMANRPPRDALPRNLMPSPDRPDPPLYRYGIPFTAKYAIDYARRHHLKINVAEEDREVFRGRVVLDFADLDDAWLKDDDDVRLFALSVSRLLMEEDLSEKCDCALEIGRPFSDDWDGIVSLWSNHNFDKRFDECLTLGCRLKF